VAGCGVLPTFAKATVGKRYWDAKRKTEHFSISDLGNRLLIILQTCINEGEAVIK